MGGAHRTGIAVGLFAVLLVTSANGQGIIIPFIGPVSRGMGGASTASHVDAIATTYWNPAAMADATASELSVGVDTLFPSMQTDSSIAFLASGSSRADPGPIPLPSIGWIHQTSNPNLTVGLSIASVGGAKTNYASSATNPLFLPQSNVPGFPGGLGRVDTSAQFIQFMPSIAYTVNESFAVGVGPTITLGQVAVDPFVFAAPDDADGSGAFRYPIGNGSKLNWGGGFQLSTYYRPVSNYSFGATYRSPQWLQPMENHSVDENGLPRLVVANVDLPMVLSIGTAYHGLPATVVGVDARYIGNRAAAGFGDEGFQPNGALAGLGFSDQYLLALGWRSQVSERFTLSTGYTFCSSPLSDAEATIAVLAPLFYQHVFSCGVSFHLRPQANFHLAYSYAPTNELRGPIATAAGPVPGSNVSTELSIHAATLGVSVMY